MEIEVKPKPKVSFKETHEFSTIEKEIPQLEIKIGELTKKLNGGFTDHIELQKIYIVNHTHTLPLLPTLYIRLTRYILGRNQMSGQVFIFYCEYLILYFCENPLTFPIFLKKTGW